MPGANSPITWGQLGATFAVVFTIVAPLTGALYVGLRDGQKETNERIKSLDEHFKDAYIAAIDVKALLKDPADLKQEIKEIQQETKQIPRLGAQYGTLPQRRLSLQLKSTSIL